jgi:excinuclease ABC subunit B
MRAAIGETERRRNKQLAYNELHGITPETIRKRIQEVIRGEEAPGEAAGGAAPPMAPWERELFEDDLRQELALLENEMWSASEALDFEKAAAVRDRIRELEARLSGRELKLPKLPPPGPKARDGARPAGRRRVQA